MSALLAFAITSVSLASGGLVALVVYVIWRFCCHARQSLSELGRRTVDQPDQPDTYVQPDTSDQLIHPIHVAEPVDTATTPVMTIWPPTVDAIVVGNDPLNIHRIVTLRTAHSPSHSSNSSHTSHL